MIVENVVQKRNESASDFKFRCCIYFEEIVKQFAEEDVIPEDINVLGSFAKDITDKIQSYYQHVHELQTTKAADGNALMEKFRAEARENAKKGIDYLRKLQKEGHLT